MKAIAFEYKLPRLAFAQITRKISPNLCTSALGPTRLTEIPQPVLLGDDWTVVRTSLCGICGSDTKQIFLDANFDNPLDALISFPNVLGHEAIGIVVEAGSAVKNLKVGQRVALNPWLPCLPRGIQPPCPACQQGRYYNCQHFTDGRLPPGMHTGNSRAATGGFAPYFPAHESMLFPIADEIPDERAVLSDPFSVSLHAVLKAPPLEDALALVYGCGSLGMLTIAILSSLYPQTKIAVIARHARQEQMARALGASHVIRAEQPVQIVEALAEIVTTRVYRSRFGMPFLLDGAGVVYDTIGSAETLSVGIRVARPAAAIVVTGVSKPHRFEWTPHYFKEINLIGSNAFGIEEFEGERLHAFQIYFKLLQEKRLRLPEMVTHRFKLDDWRQALEVSYHKNRHQAIKVVFEYPES